MTERYRIAFDTLVDRTPEPPAWEEIPRSSAVRDRRVIIGPRRAVLAALILVVSFGVVAWLVRGIGGAEAAAASVDLVELTWSQDVTLICEGGDIVDNNGFDDATIKIYGPSPDDFWRVEATAPDGSNVFFVYEGGQIPALRSWQDPAPITTNSQWPFRDAECRYPTVGFSMSKSPVQPIGNLLTSFATTRITEPSGRETDLVASLNEHPSVTTSEAIWRGLPVIVFTEERQSLDDLGRSRFFSFERWIDVEAGRVERQLRVEDQEGLGLVRSEFRVTARSSVAFDPALFDAEGMQIVMDTTGGDVEDAGPVAVTSSIPPLATPLMAGAESAELADLPGADLGEARIGDRFYRVPDTEAVFVRLRIGEPPLLFATSCSDLTAVDLPEGWTGLCGEREIDGETQTGKFSYQDVVAG